MKQSLFIVAFFLLSTTVFATDYHVDSEAGNDKQAGTSPQSAWKSLDAVNKATLKPGDRVLFKRGGVWRGQLKPQSGIKEFPITYGVYGEGKEKVYMPGGESYEKPQLRGSVPLDKPTDWIDEGNEIWSTKPDTVHAGDKIDGFDKLTWGKHHEEGADVDMAFARPGNPQYAGQKEYRLTCRKSGTQSNHIQLIVHGFKIEAGKYYLLRFFASSTKPFSIASIGFSEPGAPWGGLGTVVKRPGVINAEGKEHEILFRCEKSRDDARFTISLGGALPENAELVFVPLRLAEATVETNGINTDVGNMILDGGKAAFKKWTIADLKNEDDFWFDMAANRVFYRSKENPATRFKSIEAALHRHVVDHSNTRYVVFDELDIRYGAAHGFGGTRAKNNIYRNLDISWIGGADQYRQGGDGRRVRFGNGIEFWADASDCLVECCRLWEIYDAALTNQGSGVNVEKNITYRMNRIWNCEYSFEYWNRGPESITDNIVFEDNVCLTAGYGWGHVQRPDKNGRHLMFYSNQAKTSGVVIRNNIFAMATESPVRIDVNFRDALKMEKNVYWQPADKMLAFWLMKTRYTTKQFAEYQQETGLDGTSKIEKPDVELFPEFPLPIRELVR